MKQKIQQIEPARKSWFTSYLVEENNNQKRKFKPGLVLTEWKRGRYANKVSYPDITCSIVSIPPNFSIQLFCPGCPLPSTSLISLIVSRPDTRCFNHLLPGYIHQITMQAGITKNNLSSCSRTWKVTKFCYRFSKCHYYLTKSQFREISGGLNTDLPLQPMNS